MLDLVTIAGLAQWTDRALRKGGEEYVEALLDVSEATGRLSNGLRETLFSFVRLLGDGNGGHRLTAR